MTTTDTAHDPHRRSRLGLTVGTAAAMAIGLTTSTEAATGNIRYFSVTSSTRTAPTSPAVWLLAGRWQGRCGTSDDMNYRDQLGSALSIALAETRRLRIKGGVLRARTAGADHRHLRLVPGVLPAGPRRRR
ncbi:hypothetical protein AB0N19_24430, partial [Streptomyces sp. NPDC051132]|uniref:hypothetical protein n=1 Tax=Streptomyces sp. NPDC051132 TaxID=3155667 RepID=UPI003445F825